MNPESPGSTFGVISSESIKLIAESINWAHRATSTVTIVFKNMVQPCRCPFIQGWLFWTKEKTRTIFCSKFLRVGGDYSKAWRIGVCLDTCKPISLSFISTCIEKKNLYRFPLCSGMWPESISLNHQFINLQGYDIRTKEGWEYVLLYSTDGSPTDSTVSLSATSAVIYKIYSIDTWIVP